MKPEARDENWRPPSELMHSVPRDVRLSVQGRISAFVAVALIVGGIFLAAWIYADFSRQTAIAQRMAAEGRETGGTVTEIGRSEGKDGHHKIHYRYAVDGKSYTAITTVGARAAKGLVVSTPMVVRYLPTDPARSWMVGHEPKPVPLWVSPFVGVVTMLAAPIIFFQIKRQRFLLSEGSAAQAHVTGGRWLGASSYGGHHYRIKYEFRLPDGSLQKGSFQGSKSEFGAIGTPLTILYDPDNPQRNTGYPMPFVRLAEW